MNDDQLDAEPEGRRFDDDELDYIAENGIDGARDMRYLMNTIRHLQWSVRERDARLEAGIALCDRWPRDAMAQQFRSALVAGSTPNPEEETP